MAKIEVHMANGKRLMCDAVEKIGYNHDMGGYVASVRHFNTKYMAVKVTGAGSIWREWSGVDRTRPLRQHLAALHSTRIDEEK